MPPLKLCLSSLKLTALLQHDWAISGLLIQPTIWACTFQCQGWKLIGCLMKPFHVIEPMHSRLCSVYKQFPHLELYWCQLFCGIPDFYMKLDPVKLLFFRRQARSVFFQRWKCTVNQARQKQNKPPAKKSHNEERRAPSDEESARSVL